MRLTLSLATAANPRSWPILDGTVKPDGIDLVPTVIHPSEMFWRQLKFQDFDISEMSMSSLMMATAQGNNDWVGIPIFTTRKFFHTEILVRKDAGINEPKDLKGKRVGVPEYQQTAALWARGVLQHEFGVHQSEMEHWMERVPTHSHGGATGFKPPPGTTVNQIPIEKSLGGMMVSGELQATIHYLRDNNLVDRSRVDLEHHPDIKPLFPDPDRRGRALLQEDRHLPDQPRHGDPARDRREASMDRAQPAQGLRQGQRDRQPAAHRAGGVSRLEPARFRRRPARRCASRRSVTASRPTARRSKWRRNMSHEQGLTPRLMKLEELFAPSAMEQ